MHEQFDNLIHETARMCRDARLTIGDGPDGARVARMQVEGRDFLAVSAAACDDRFTVYCDFGQVDDERGLAVCRDALTRNLSMAGAVNGAFGLDPATGHLIYATTGDMAATTAAHLRATIDALNLHAADWALDVSAEIAR